MRKMRSISLLLFVITILYLSFHGADCDINFSLTGATKDTYKTLIRDLRRELSIRTHKVYDITVLKHQIADNYRFLLIHLSNYDHQTITLGIDVFDVYVVGYLTGTNAYIFQDVPALAHTVSLFPGSRKENLTYSGSYGDLGSKLRETLPLGLPPLDSAITNLFLYDATSLKSSFLVIIQMICEAARFKYIEATVAQNFHGDNKFIPDPAFLSLENKWGSLSKEIQEAQRNKGVFLHEVVVYSVTGKRIEVKNVSDPVVKGVALMKYHQLAVMRGVIHSLINIVKSFYFFDTGSLTVENNIGEEETHDEMR